MPSCLSSGSLEAEPRGGFLCKWFVEGELSGAACKDLVRGQQSQVQQELSSACLAPAGALGTGLSWPGFTSYWLRPLPTTGISA